MSDCGWFVTAEENAPGAAIGHPWEIWLQTEGAAFPLHGVCFATEEEALEFLRVRVLGVGEIEG